MNFEQKLSKFDGPLSPQFLDRAVPERIMLIRDVWIF